MLDECLLVLGGVLLLSPTRHPWYLLWILPFAAAKRSWAWLTLCGTVPLAYLAGAGDISMPVRLAVYLPAAAVWIWERLRSR